MNNNNQIPNSNNYNNNPNTFNPQTNQFNQYNQNLGFYQQNTNSNYNMQPNISPNQNFQTNQFNQQGVYYEQQNTITPQPIEEKPPYNPQPTPNEPIIENSTPSLNELNVDGTYNKITKEEPEINNSNQTKKKTITLTKENKVFITIIIVAIRRIKHTRDALIKEQIKLFLAMSIVCLLAYGMFLAGWADGYDATLPAYFICVQILIMLMLRYELFNTLSLAKEDATDRMSEAVIVFDNDDDIIYLNRNAELLKQYIEKNYKEEVFQVLKQLDKEKKHLLVHGSIFVGDRSDYQENIHVPLNSVYHISSRKIVKNNRSYGITYVISDETDSYYYTERLEADVREKTHEIVRMQRSIIGSFATMIEARDGITGLHIKNTGNFVRTLVDAMREDVRYKDTITKEYADMVAEAAYLHDIGKISIPDEVLQKPGKLTNEEFDIMKTHPAEGARIIKETLGKMENDEYVKIAYDMAYYHHERWDGNGYPDGLSRESIPVLSRVIAVVDAFDAMINDRPYRKGMPISKAIEELKSCAGSQFDPYIVSEFIRLVSEKYANSLENESKQRAADGGVGADGNGENVGDRTAPGDGLADSDGDGASTDDGQTEIRIMARRQKVDSSEYGKDAFRVHTVKHSRYLVDENWRIISVDDNFEKLTGYSKEDIENNIITQIDLIPDEDKTEYLCQVNANLAKSTFVFQEHKIHRKDGRDIYVLCAGRMFYDSALQKDRGEIVIVDVSSTYALKMLTDAEQNKADVRLRNWENTYRTDPLTGLLNHAAFRSDMEQRLLECTHTAVMIMMDVDRFKQYNDTYGHHNGDKYLVLVAQTLQAALRGDDHACRMGGDEFAAMLFFNKSVSDNVIRERAQQIFDKVNLTVKATEGGTGISMGAVIARTELTFNEMYEEADNALYDVKESGRGRIEVKRHGE